jgi:hypothetical protein
MLIFVKEDKICGHVNAEWILSSTLVTVTFSLNTNERTQLSEKYIAFNFVRFVASPLYRLNRIE